MLIHLFLFRRAGGHNPNAGFSSVQNNGILIDLSQLNAKSYDPATQLATYGPGGTFGDVYDYFAQYGRTVVGARLAGVGTGLGLAGLSYLSGQYGLACDGFRELEVVLPSGRVVTASAQSNPDLFLALKGGGGNAYGVVTRYTVASRPAATFYAGNLAFLFNQTDAVLAATQDFARYNQDPKAAIITTYEKLPTPGLQELGLNLDEAVIMFLVYDGEDDKGAFKVCYSVMQECAGADHLAYPIWQNFTSIPHVLNTLGRKSYKEVVNMPVPGAAGAPPVGNIFRNSVHRVEGNGIAVALDTWREWADSHKGLYLLSSLDLQPVPRSLTDASKAQGGNALAMPDGPWLWINYLISNVPGPIFDAGKASFKEMVSSIPNAPGLPLFINDASYDQNPLQTYSTFSRLQGIKRKYDPDNFFATKTGGWSFA